MAKLCQGSCEVAKEKILYLRSEQGAICTIRSVWYCESEEGEGEVVKRKTVMRYVKLRQGRCDVVKERMML